jgi:hypothetical protein
LGKPKSVILGLTTKKSRDDPPDSCGQSAHPVKTPWGWRALVAGGEIGVLRCVWDYYVHRLRGHSDNNEAATFAALVVGTPKERVQGRYRSWSRRRDNGAE